MNRLTDNKIILVTRPTRLAELVARFNTVSQARFYLEHQGADFSDYSRENERYHASLADAQAALAPLGRVHMVDRSFLPNFVFGPDDVIVALGQDGLVANTLKYLHGQPVVGVNPDPARWDGKLLPFLVPDLPRVMPETIARRRPTKTVTMAKASLNNGQSLYAVNDLFIGPKSHISAQYTVRSGAASETQSSSGVVVSTGMGSSGWLKSLITGAAAVTRLANAIRKRDAGPAETNAGGTVQPRTNAAGVTTDFPWDAQYLYFTVREPFPTRRTGATLVFGKITGDIPLVLESHMAGHGVIFSDGIEKDFLDFNSGTVATISVAERQGVLVI